jgi:hypothetical protein
MALPLALLYTRSLHGVIGDYSETTKPASRSGPRVRLSNGNGRRAKKDLREWARLGEGGRVVVKEEPQWALHTDAAELGWGGTSGPDEGPGAQGTKEVSGVWGDEERKQDITLRELRAVSLVLGRGLGVDVQHREVSKLRLWIYNQGAKGVISKIRSKSPKLMREILVLHRLLQ